MKNLKIYDPNSGQWYKAIDHRKPKIGDLYMNGNRHVDCAEFDFSSIQCIILVACKPLTQRRGVKKIEDPLQKKK